MGCNLCNTPVQFATLFLALLVLAQTQDIDPSLRRPPSIEVQPTEKWGQKHIYTYSQNLQIELPCSASGTPKPEYIWKKDGVEIARLKDDGKYLVTQLRENNGRYQCFAENLYGTALSDSIELVVADIGPFSDDQTIRKTVKEGEPLKLHCNGLPASVPDPKITWAVSKERGDTSPITIQVDNRLSIDDEGALHFAYTTMSDNKFNDQMERGLYTCNAYNGFLLASYGGSFHELTVNINAAAVDTPAKMEWSTPSPVTALVTKELVIKCICIGKPSPSVSWERVGSRLPGAPRQLVRDSGRELVISPVQDDDEGEYRCRCTNGVNGGSAQERTIMVNVESAAQWVIQPLNKNATEAKAASFICRGSGEPVPTIQWLKNGQPIEAINDKRVTVSPDGTNLTIADLKKATDLMVVQCNISNIHGYAFGDAYLNVLEPTVFVLQPTNVQLDPETDVIFKCQAKTDPSLRITIDWLRDGELIVYKQDQIFKNDENSLVIMTSQMDDKGAKYADSTYTCQAQTAMGAEQANARLESIIGPGGVTGASTGFPWYIIVIVAVILLIIIIFLICCCCLRNNKGDSYPVDRNERKAGHDPEKEMADSGFHDYTRPEDQPGARSRASISSSIKYDSEEDEELDQYGDIDTGKFNEDGSFIGLYGQDKKKKKRRDDDNTYDNSVMLPPAPADTTV
ncbi:unnamed protein product [Owenia fusiformis]|uniref:Ig-like domain-containing protein n=1 Tax=Owenia fusiformis TaxID=6347 RepID=A0A8S4N1V4_OWEFU|nr:unnamed protein product [Owenia fusiformis]